MLSLSRGCLRSCGITQLGQQTTEVHKTFINYPAEALQKMASTVVVLSRYEFFLEIWLAAKNALGRTPQFEVYVGPVEQNAVAILDWISKETALQ